MNVPAEAVKTGVANGVEHAVETTKKEGIIEGLKEGAKAATVNSVKTQRVAFRFEGSNITRTTVRFANANCDGEAYRLTEQGTFNISKNQATNDGGRPMDISYKSVSVTPASEEGAATLNNISLCGKADWKKDGKQDVTAQAQDKKINCSKDTVPRENKNVYRIFDGKVLVLGTETLENGNPAPASLSGVKYTAR